MSFKTILKLPDDSGGNLELPEASVIVIVVIPVYTDTSTIKTLKCFVWLHFVFTFPHIFLSLLNLQILHGTES